MGRETELLNVIELAYSAAMDEEKWQTFLNASADLFGAVGVSFEIHDKKTGHPMMVELSAEIPDDLSPEYLTHYARVSPRVRYGLTTKPGVISYDYAILTEAEMDGDEYYNKFLGTHDLRYFISSTLLNNDNHFCAFAAQRSASQEHVGDDEIDLMQRLMPHIKQAVDLRFRLRDADALSGSMLEGLNCLTEAALLIEASGIVFYANRAAEKILATGDGVRITDKLVHFTDKTAARHYDDALRGMIGGKGQISDLEKRDFIACRASGNRPYLVSLRPLPSYNHYHISTHGNVAAIVFIRDPSDFSPLNTNLLKQSYQLTPAELDIAVSLDKGQSISEVAKRRGVSVLTVRSQLYGLMNKLSVNRQIDLMRLMRNYHRPFD